MRLRLRATLLMLLSTIGCTQQSPQADRSQAPGQNETEEKVGRLPDIQDEAARAYADIPDNQKIVHRAQAGEPDTEGWCLATSSRGTFSVLLPGKFVDTMIKSTTTTGGTGVLHTVATQAADGVEFSVLQTELIGPRPRAMDGSPDSLIARFEQKGATVRRSEATIDGQSATRLEATAPGVTAEIVLISTPANDYMLSVQRRTPGALPAADVEKFFQSFQRLP